MREVEGMLKASYFVSESIKIWTVVSDEHAYFTASLCNAGLGNR